MEASGDEWDALDKKEVRVPGWQMNGRAEHLSMIHGENCLAEGNRRSRDVLPGVCRSSHQQLWPRKVVPGRRMEGGGVHVHVRRSEEQRKGVNYSEFQKETQDARTQTTKLRMSNDSCILERCPIIIRSNRSFASGALQHWLHGPV